MPLSFLLVLAVIATVLQDKTDRTAVWSQRSAHALDESAAMVTALGEANAAAVEFSRRPKTSLVGRYDAGLAALGAHERELRRLVAGDPAEERLARRYLTLTDQIVNQLLTPFFDLSRAGRKSEAQAVSRRLRPLVVQWQDAHDAFELSERQLLLARYATLHVELQRLGTALLIASVAGVALTLILTARFGLRIARRLWRLAENARRLGRGEPTPVIEGEDEIADLDRVYHEMTERITETLRQKEEVLAAYERAQHVASTLQTALMPQDLPELPGIAFDAVYVPGRSEALVGGDWYDALRLADGRVLITIGDVAGSGLEAAVIMAAMREVIRGVAHVYADPATLVDAADRTLKAEHRDRLVTACVAVFDPVARTLTYCSAGHPPPLLRAPDGTITELDAFGLPLGLRTRECDARVVPIPDGATVLFYTDGLIESTQDIVEGERELRVALADPAIAARADIAHALHDAILRHGAHDDVAILAMRVAPVSGELDGEHFRRWSFDTADVVTAQRARTLFATVLAEAGMLDDDVFTSELIFGELLSNAVRYARGRVDVILDWTRESNAILHFLDHGPGFVVVSRLPTDLLSERGRGLFLVWSLSEDFNVTKRPGGGAHVRVVLSPRRKVNRNAVAGIAAVSAGATVMRDPAVLDSPS